MTINLTPAQIEAADWCIGGMEDIFDNPPFISNGKLIIDDVRDIVEDILYRLEIQAPDVAEGSDTIAEKNGFIRTCSNLAKKIRKQTQLKNLVVI